MPAIFPCQSIVYRLFLFAGHGRFSSFVYATRHLYASTYNLKVYLAQTGSRRERDSDGTWGRLALDRAVGGVQWASDGDGEERAPESRQGNMKKKERSQ